MQTWRDFKESLAASQQQNVPPFRPAGPADLATAGVPGSSSSHSGLSVGAERLDLLPGRLRFGSSSWPLPGAPPLRDAALTIHLGDLYKRPNHAAHDAASARIAADTTGDPHADSSTPGVRELRAAVRAWLLAKPHGGVCWTDASRDLARYSEGATPEDWLQILDLIISSNGLALPAEEAGFAACQRGDGGKLLAAGVSIDDALCSLIVACSGFGDCVLSHALPFLLASSWCEKTGPSSIAGAGSADGLNPALVRVIRQAFAMSSWNACTPVETQRRLVQLGLSASRLPHAYAVEALLMELSAESRCSVAAS